ncbi:hypothetical protein WSK_3380 [Novosphingobium sp. Rr 2-17]|uniref:universal stress protein n=1 Tax=Novosphingobium sp. Rr 2-17 TaxID=555793 RepID=UPI0002699573|nr:universal stress protein [Novosphingobium sp. Rr 2-17]EIZ78070.1 hypothetical protein WSK_3380 [Novosphingobium sp. Rr 2-17]
MRSILVMADHKPGSEACLEAAIELARQRDGHLTVLVDTPFSRFIATDPMGGNYILAEALDKARKEDDAFAAAIEERIARSGIPFDVVRSEDDQVSALAAAARLSDLVVVSRSSGQAGELALVSRTPVLALPDASHLALPIRRACVAWDGGEQAAAALRGAVPLLKTCELVKVISVTEKAGGFPATDALRYLSRHGIHADYEEYERQASTEETLAIAVTQSHAELLVMGAYGKSRMREFLFGGVTAYFLKEATAPALLLQH